MSTACLTDTLVERIGSLASPLQVRPTGQTPSSVPLGSLEAVLFDVYGTLVISGSGEIGVADEGEDAAKARALHEALAACGIDADPAAAAEGVRRFPPMIREHHAIRKNAGVETPEVEIREVWRDILAALVRDGRLRLDGDAAFDLSDCVSRLAVEYECRVNPAWPMPRLAETLDRLREKGILLGIVSNAQFFTPLLFPALAKRSLDDFGFDPDLRVWSYKLREAKPSTRLYERARDMLADRAMPPERVLYIGNDMLNDVLPAARVGFRTALFAGDARSLRLREDDPRCTGVRPDRIVTDLGQIPKLLG